MAVTINASTSAGLVQTADTTGNLNIQSNGSTVVAVTSAGAAVTGTLSSTGDGSISGRLGVGAAASATYPLNLVQNDSNYVRILANSSRVWRIGAEGSTAGNGLFRLIDDSAGVQRMAVNASGSTVFGAGPSQGYNLESNSNSLSLAYFYRISDGTGVYLPLGNNTWSSASDERLKDIIEPITDAASKVSLLRAVIGKYKTDEDGVRRPFIIAQDVQKALPEAVDDAPNKDEDGKPMMGVQYTNIIPLLVAAIKEQTEQIKTLTDRIAALESKQ